MYYNNWPEYCPEVIAEALCEFAKRDARNEDDDEEDILSDTREFLLDLKVLADNEYNREYFRTFYNLLQKITENIEAARK